MIGCREMGSKVIISSTVRSSGDKRNHFYRNIIGYRQEGRKSVSVKKNSEKRRNIRMWNLWKFNLCVSKVDENANDVKKSKLFCMRIDADNDTCEWSDRIEESNFVVPCHSLNRYEAFNFKHNFTNWFYANSSINQHSQWHYWHSQPTPPKNSMMLTHFFLYKKCQNINSSFYLPW